MLSTRDFMNENPTLPYEKTNILHGACCETLSMAFWQTEWMLLELGRYCSASWALLKLWSGIDISKPPNAVIVRFLNVYYLSSYKASNSKFMNAFPYCNKNPVLQ